MRTWALCISLPAERPLFSSFSCSSSSRILLSIFVSLQKAKNYLYILMSVTSYTKVNLRKCKDEHKDDKYLTWPWVEGSPGSHRSRVLHLKPVGSGESPHWCKILHTWWWDRLEPTHHTSAHRETFRRYKQCHLQVLRGKYPGKTFITEILSPFWK